MRFISDIGRPWTVGELQVTFKFHKMGYSVSLIAALLLRSEREIMAVL